MYYRIQFLQGSFIDEFSGSHEINENSLKSGISLESLDAEIPEIENIVLQSPNHTMHIPEKYDPVILHEHVFFLGPKFQVTSSRGVILPLLNESNNIKFPDHYNYIYIIEIQFLKKRI